MDLPKSNVILSGDNPSPFVQPFLELQLVGGESEKLSDGGTMVIDVDGKIDKYITEDKEPTELLVELCTSLANAGAVVSSFDSYIGSAGPGFILQNGAMFRRMEAIEYPPVSVLAYKYRKPEYRGS